MARESFISERDRTPLAQDFCVGCKPNIDDRTLETHSLKPILKWAGGKRNLVRQILELKPSSFNRYHEPFVGGCAVLWSLRPSDAVAADVNNELINLHESIRLEPKLLIQELRAIRLRLELELKKFELLTENEVDAHLDGLIELKPRQAQELRIHGWVPLHQLSDCQSVSLVIG